MEHTVTGVGVLDKAVRILAAVEARPLDLAGLVGATGLPRATAHRLAVALEAHGLVRRDGDGRFAPGLRLVGLGRAAAAALPLADAARPALAALRDATGESVQLYVREGDRRVCVASLESPHGLRTIVPLGAALPLGVGSAGRILAAVDAAPSAWIPRGIHADGSGGDAPEAVGPAGATPGEDDPGRIPRGIHANWVASVAEREPGVASVSAAVRDHAGRVVAAVGISGPVDRLGTDPGARHGDAVVAAARAIERAAGLTDGAG